MVSSESTILRLFGWAKREVAKWRLHPLIHTLLGFNLVIDVVGTKKRSQELRIFLVLNQDIVAWSQEEKCGLKYVIHIPSFTGALKKRSRSSAWSLRNE